MIAQLMFLPSIMLSGIMFPIDLLPDFLGIYRAYFSRFLGIQIDVRSWLLS